ARVNYCCASSDSDINRIGAVLVQAACPFVGHLGQHGRCDPNDRTDRQQKTSHWPSPLPQEDRRTPASREIPSPGQSEWPSPKVGARGRLLGNYAGIIELGGAGGLAFDKHLRAGPHRDAPAAATAVLITHDVAPLLAVDVTMPVGERRHDLVTGELVARANDMY